MTDDMDTRVCVDKAADRVIALYGALNEIVISLGLGEVLVARTAQDADLPGLDDKPCIGTHMRPGVEKILELDPDLVLQMGSRSRAKMSVESLKRFGLDVAFFRVEDFQDLFSVIRRVGKLLGVEARAADLVNDMRERLWAVQEEVRGRIRPEVFFEVRYPNLLAAGRGNMVSDIIRRAGGKNCVRAKRKLVRLNEEELVRMDPGVYLVQKGPMNPDPVPVASRPHFKTLPAVRKNQVYVVEEMLFSRPGPRSVDAVEELATILHPGVGLDTD
ncbi:MAG: ABC transporter substrate-binding protein [Desulfonatronovibrionaceae bacterium]